MNKLFGLLLLALAFLPGGAEAASRFLICTTSCTITAADTSIWSATSGGATGASVPGSSDDVTLDANTCVGGTTCTATFGSGYNPTWLSVTQSACTASTSGCILDANTNSNTITLTATGYTNTGSGTRTVSGGTWIISATGGLWNVNSSLTVSNAPNVSFTGASNNGRQFVGGGKTYGTLSVGSSTGGGFTITNNNTIGTLTVTAPNKIYFASGSSNTITTLTNVTGTSSNTVLFASAANSNATVSSANNWTCTWCGFSWITFTGGGTFTANSSLAFGDVVGITVNPPSGGGGGGRIIGG